MIRHDVDLRLEAIDQQQVRTAVAAHHQALAHPGDFFLPSKQLAGESAKIIIDGTACGIVTVADGALVLCILAQRARRYDRQVMELALDTFGVTEAYAASWDGHHINLFGGFAEDIANQAYQFELVDPDHLDRRPDRQVTLDFATEADLPYLTSVDFLDDYTEPLAAGQVRIARRDGRAVGIGNVVPHPLNEAVVDVGMFTNPDVRRQGVGRDIIALVAEESLGRGLTPAAGCWAQNWQSRPTLEAAGLTCVGTIFRFTLNPNTFRNHDAA